MTKNPPRPTEPAAYQQISRQNKRLNLLLSETDAIYHEAAKRMGLSDSVSKILYTICQFGQSCLLQDIVRLSGCNKQTLNSALRKLEQQGMVYLQNAAGRRKLVCLTENGQKLAADTVQRLIELENEAMLNWTEQETAVYLELTQRYLEDLRKKIQTL